MNLFLLRQANLWGDYGDVLASGYCSRDKESGEIRLHRSGPFVPPVSFPSSSDYGCPMVVTDAFRRELEQSPLGSLSFKRALKSRIVKLNFAWERWDKTSDYVQKRPPGGEPEAYIMDKPHSPNVASAMPELWEVVPPVIECDIEFVDARPPDWRDKYHFSPLSGEYCGLFRNREERFRLVVDELARRWLEGRVSEWVEFVPLVMNTPKQ